MPQKTQLVDDSLLNRKPIANVNAVEQMSRDLVVPDVKQVLLHAAFCTSWSGAMVDAGRLANTALQ